MVLVWKKTGIKPEELTLELPVVFFELWEWFIELHMARGSNGMTLNPISFTEIKAWAELTGTEITPKEVRLLKMLDGAVLNG